MSADNDNIMEAATMEEDTTKDKYLTFVIDNEEYGVEIANIKEIISVCAITLVPETPAYVKGIINLRGDIIPVIDVRRRFMKEAKEYDDLTCIVVIEHSAFVLGLIVDNVKEVMFIKEENVLPPPSAKLKYYNQFIKSIGKIDERIILLMDLERFLSQE